MGQYRIAFFDDNQDKQTKIVIAESEDDAIIKLGIDDHDIIKVTKEFIPASEKIPISNQITVLSALYSAALSGQNVITTLANTINSLYSKGVVKDKVDLLANSGLSLSEMLTQLKFNGVAINLVSAGEVSGSLDNGLMEAEKYLELNDEVVEITGSGIKTAIPFVLIGFMILLFYPLLIGDVVTDLVGPESANFFTDMILFLRDYLVETIVGIVLFLLLLLYLRLFHWNIIRGLYPFSIFDRLLLLQNALVFLSIYATLDRYGVEVRKIVNTYEEVNPKNAEKMTKMLDSGESITVAIKEADFPEDWVKTSSTILDFEDKNAKEKAIEGLFTLLKKQIRRQAEKASGIIAIIGKALVILAIAMILAGFYFPAMSFQV